MRASTRVARCHAVEGDGRGAAGAAPLVRRQAATPRHTTPRRRLRHRRAALARPRPGGGGGLSLPPTSS
eukprot:scaffold233_cov548-Prasinococcus_capsulatus_cf.AAC.1